MDAIYAFLTLKISSIEFRKCLLEDEELLERVAAKLPKSTFAMIQSGRIRRCAPKHLHTTTLIFAKRLRQAITVLENYGAPAMDIS